jgi:hypothetical protein
LEVDVRRLFPLITVCLLLSAAAQPLFAQQRAFVFANRNILEVETSGPAFGRVIRLIPWSSPHALQDVTPIGAGAFIAWMVDGLIHVLDSHSGSIQRYVIPGFFQDRILGTDESTFRVFLLMETDAFSRVLSVDLRTGSTQTIDLAGRPLLAGVAYAPRANLLFVARREEPISHIDVISADTGVTVRSLTVPPVSGGFLGSVSPSGTRLFLHGSEGLTVVDSVTGSLIGRIPSSAVINGTPIIDEDRNRLLVTTGASGPASLAAYSLDSMQLLGRIELSQLGISGASNFDVSPQSATMLALYYAPSADSNFPMALAGLSVDTGQLRATADLPGLGTQIYDVDLALVRLTEPSAPREFAANATGSRVELSWAPTGALRYEIEVGSAPGLANLATLRVTDTHLTVDGVPSGAYYLRVRAINTIGESGASQEVQVVVP